MKTNYINQFQRDASGWGIITSTPIHITEPMQTYKGKTLTVEDVSMEDAAVKSFKNHNIGEHDLAQDVYEDGFKAGANEMLPIIRSINKNLS